jgi:hypothetical protein
MDARAALHRGKWATTGRRQGVGGRTYRPPEPEVHPGRREPPPAGRLLQPCHAGRRPPAPPAPGEQHLRDHAADGLRRAGVPPPLRLVLVRIGGGDVRADGAPLGPGGGFGGSATLHDGVDAYHCALRARARTIIILGSRVSSGQSAPLGIPKVLVSLKARPFPLRLDLAFALCRLRFE